MVFKGGGDVSGGTYRIEQKPCGRDLLAESGTSGFQGEGGITEQGNCVLTLQPSIRFGAVPDD